MVLKSDNYEFWTSFDTESWEDSVDIMIGNDNGLPQPCVKISVYQDEIVLQDLFYYKTCSSNAQLEKRAGTIEMVQAALKAVVTNYPSPNKIMIHDMSYFPSKALGNVPIPELKALESGYTWYQEHFGATPTKDTAKIMNKYMIARTNVLPGTDTVVHEYIAQNKKTLTEADIHAIRESLNLPVLTGNYWEISKSTALAYNTRAHFVDDQLGGRRMKKTAVLRYLPRPRTIRG